MGSASLFALYIVLGFVVIFQSAAAKTPCGTSRKAGSGRTRQTRMVIANGTTAANTTDQQDCPPWSTVERNKYFPCDLQKCHLQIRSAAEVVDSKPTLLLLNFKTTKIANYLAYFIIRFTESPQYYIRGCTAGWTDLEAGVVPAERNKTWTISRNRTFLQVVCNGVQVLNFDIRDAKFKYADCKSAIGYVEKIAFHSLDSVSDRYRRLKYAGDSTTGSIPVYMNTSANTSEKTTDRAPTAPPVTTTLHPTPSVPTPYWDRDAYTEYDDEASGDDPAIEFGDQSFQGARPGAVFPFLQTTNMFCWNEYANVFAHIRQDCGEDGFCCSKFGYRSGCCEHRTSCCKSYREPHLCCGVEDSCCGNGNHTVCCHRFTECIYDHYEDTYYCSHHHWAPLLSIPIYWVISIVTYLILKHKLGRFRSKGIVVHEQQQFTTTVQNPQFQNPQFQNPLFTNQNTVIIH